MINNRVNITTKFKPIFKVIIYSLIFSFCFSLISTLIIDNKNFFIIKPNIECHYVHNNEIYQSSSNKF